MSTEPRPRRGAHLLPYAVAALGAGVWAHAFTSLGLGLSRDSAHYLSVAFRLRHGGELLLDAAAYPPGYPLTIATASLLEPFPVDAAAWVAGFSLAAALGGMAWLALRLGASPIAAAAAVAVCATLDALVQLHWIALSEAPFGALLVLHVVFVGRHLRSGRGIDLGTAAVLAAAAALTRYAGYGLLFSFTAYVLWCLRRSKPPRLQRAEAAFALGAAGLPSLALATYNLVANGTAFGRRAASASSLGETLQRIALTLGEDLGLIVSTLVLASALAIVFSAIRSGPARALIPADEPDVRDAALALYSVTCVAALLTVTAISVSQIRIDAVGYRYLVPLYPVVLAWVAAAPMRLPLRGPARHLAHGALLVALLGVAVGQARACAVLLESIATAPERGLWHSEVGFDVQEKTSELRAFLSALASNGPRLGTGLSVLVPTGERSHAALAQSLLLRRSVAGDAAHFENASAAGFDVVDASGDARIAYRHLPLPRDERLRWASVRSAALRIAHDRGAEAHWVLVAASRDPLSAERPPLERVGAYHAYRFMRDTGPERPPAQPATNASSSGPPAL